MPAPRAPTSERSSPGCSPTGGEAKTKSWLEGMKTNARIYENNIATMKAVNAGEVPMGVIFHYYWYRDRSRDQGGHGQHQAALLQARGPGRLRQPLGRGRAQERQAPRRGAEVRGLHSL
nr:hypothetical protein [Janibacter limosus]